MPQTRCSLVVRKFDADRSQIIAPVTAVPCRVAFIDVATDVIAIHPIMSRCGIGLKDIAALLHREIPGHVMDEDLVYSTMTRISIKRETH